MSGRLAGQPILWDRVGSWTRRRGVSPARASFAFHVEDGLKVLAAGRGMSPITLELAGQAPVRNLLIAGVSRGDHPDMLTIDVADHRLVWGRKYVILRRNLTKRTGGKRWLGGAIGQIPALVDDIGYRLATIKNGTTPYKSTEILLALLEGLQAKLRGDGIVFSVPSTLPIGIFGGDAENFEVDASFDEALRQALAEVPGLDLDLDLDGNIVLHDRNSKADVNIIRNRTAEAGPQLAAAESLASIRPRYVIVRFTRELELWVRAIQEDGEGVRRPPGWIDLSEGARMVIPCPYPELEVGGVTRNAGEWLTWEGFLAAIASVARRSGAPALATEIVRKQWAGRRLMATYAAPVGSVPSDTDWTRIITAVYGHFRQSFRLARELQEGLLSWTPTRGAVIDPETGERMPSRVYSDYSLTWDQTPDFRKLSDEDKCTVNISNYAARLEDCRESEVYLNVVDYDLGILSSSFNETAWGGVREIYPSKIDEATIPLLRPARFGRRSFIAVDQAGAQILSEGHRWSTVITGIPLADETHDIQVQAPTTEGPCLGPPVEIRVSPALVTAIHAWSTEKEDAILSAFGQRAGGEKDPGAVDPADELASLLINGDILQEVAERVRDRYYAELGDRGVGALVLPGLQLDIQPEGSIGGVTYSVGPDGHQSTTVTYDQPRVSPRLIDLLGKGARRMLFRLVASGGKG